MKYPFVLFYRKEKYSEVDDFLKDEKLNCTIFIINDDSELNKLFNPNNQILITYGPNESEYSSVSSVISNRIRDRWIHLRSIESIDHFNRIVNYCFINNCTFTRTHIRPIFSIFTTTYNSYNKIIRAYNSVKKQTFIDYEWVILDDSPDDSHFIFLKDLFKNDSKIRLYKRSENSGNIGNVKNEVVSLCRGKYVIELDHDDEILPHVLSDSVKCFEEDSDIGFIYMDFINIYENGNNFKYGNFICKGYGSYYCQKYNNKWVYVYNTPNINNITLSHLVCCPNHPRIWKRSVLIEAGNYSEFLPICDDYEILLRTFITTKMAKIHKLGYVQYMNDSNNNFSLIRNSEINRIGPQFIQPIFYKKFDINEKCKELDCYEDEKFIYNHSMIWNREKYIHKYSNKLINLNYDKQYCIIGLDTLKDNIELIKNLYTNLQNDFILLDSNIKIEEIQNVLDSFGFDRFKCYSLEDHLNDQLINYFLIMYKSLNNYEIIKSKNHQLPFNTELSHRYEVINENTKPEESYLEIGLEYGYNFKNVHFNNKIGVDPDPKFSDKNIIKLTSDDYFKEYLDLSFDNIFIDGMHQCEYVLRDFNNSISILKENGTIFIDDIIPMSYNEQLKIPNKHYYENGILKYGEPWTGDVWKIMYYLLKYHKNDFEFKYYNNKYYRGVAVLKIINKFNIPESKITEINDYDYYNDFLDFIVKMF